MDAAMRCTMSALRARRRRRISKVSSEVDTSPPLPGLDFLRLSIWLFLYVRWARLDRNVMPRGSLKACMIENSKTQHGVIQPLQNHAYSPVMKLHYDCLFVQFGRHASDLLTQTYTSIGARPFSVLMAVCMSCCFLPWSLRILARALS